MDIKFSRMNILDLPDVMELEHDCFSEPWSEKLFRDELELEYSTILLARGNDKKLLGFVCYWILVDELHILNVAVRDNMRRRGIGTRLVREALRVAAARYVEAATLEVRESNLPAIGLYGSLGFEKAGIRRNYYDKPRENAVIMWLYDIAGHGRKSS